MKVDVQMRTKMNKALNRGPNIYQVLNPLFVWTTLQGLTPFSPKRTGFVPSKWHLFFSLFLLCVYSSISVRTIIRKEIDGKDGLIANITETLELYITNVNMVAAILLACIQRNKILDVIAEINKMDTSMKLYFPHMHFDYKKQCMSFYALLVLVNLYILFSFALDVFLFVEADFFTSVKMAYTFMCPKMISTHVVIQFCYLNAILKRRFLMLNQKLDSLSTDVSLTLSPLNLIYEISGVKTSAPSSSEKLFHLIDNIRMKHFKLCEIAHLLNDAYGGQILFTTLQVFITLLAGIFYCIRVVAIKQGGTTSEDPRLIVPYTVNIVILSFMQMTCVAVFASNTHYEAKKTGCLIHKFRISERNNKDLEFEITYFSLQLMHHNVDFNACRIFKIDESLLLSIIGVICTYLVIVIQFEFASIQEESTK